MADHPTLETPRLQLRPLALDHAADLFPIYHDPLSMRLWSGSVHAVQAETGAMIRQKLRNHQGEQLWTIYRRDTHEAIGSINFIFARVTGMGYLIRSSDWRKGYGTEAATAALDYGFRAYNLSRIELWIDERNTASQALARKLGFRQRGQFYNQHTPGEPPRETLVLGLRAQEWAHFRGNEAASVPREVAFYDTTPLLPERNVPETLAFYRDRLGFNVDWCNTDEVTATFAILSRGEWTTERAALQLTQVENPGAVGGRLYIKVGLGLDRLHDEFVANGVRVTSPLTRKPYGTREFEIEDNNGWPLTFASEV